MPLLPARFQPTDIPTKLGRKLPSKAEEKAKTDAANAEYEKRRLLQRFESGRHDLHLVAEGIRDHLAAKKKAEQALHSRGLQEKFDAQMAGALSAHHVTELPDSVVSGLGSEPLAKEAASFNDEWTEWIEHDGSECPIESIGSLAYEVRFQNGGEQRPKCPPSRLAWHPRCGGYSIIAYRLRKPKSEWGPWIAHKAGPCPIPEAKAGEYEIRWKTFGGLEREHRPESVGASCVYGWADGTITYYRLKA